MVIDSVVDPPHFDADPDSTYHPDEDPDADYYLMLMRIRIGIFNLSGSGSGSRSLLQNKGSCNGRFWMPYFIP